MPECATARPEALREGETMVECHLYSRALATVR
jgi:hypothetical protein